MSLAGLVVAALNAAWQTGLLVLVAGAVLRIVRVPAAGQAAVWGAVFFTGASLLPLDLAVQSWSAHDRAAKPTIVAAAGTAAVQSSEARRTRNVSYVTRSVATAPMTLALDVSRLARAVAVPFASLWLLAAAWQLLVLVRSVLRIRGIKRRARLLEGSASLTAMVSSVRGCRIGTSDDVGVPCAAGFARPMILLPSALVDQLCSEQLCAVVTHELAHIRRWDDLWKLAQRAAGALCCVNPALRLVSARVDFYREAACDDRVVSSRASALSYAECLANVLERTVVRRSAAVPALIRAPRQVRARVERLVNWRKETPIMGRAAVLIALAVCATALFFVRAELPAIFPQDAQSPREEADVHAIVVSNDGDHDTLIGALGAAGYRLTVDDVIAVRNAGVDPDFVMTVARSGIERPSVTDLIAMANAGVDCDLVTAAVHTFGSKVNATDLVELQNAGVDSDDLSSYRHASDAGLTVHDAIALHNAGVDGDYVRHVLAIEHGHLSVRDVIRLHDAGVDV